MPPPPPPDSPYEPPSQYDPGHHGSEQAREALSTPAIILMVLVGIGLLMQIGSLAMTAISPGGAYSYEELLQDPELQQIFEENPEVGEMAETFLQYAGGSNYFFLALTFLAGLIMFYGAFKMRSGESYGLAMATAILATIPCFSPCCCLLEMPIGIWMLVLLTKPEIKGAFV
jgi:amino acid transporter